MKEMREIPSPGFGTWNIADKDAARLVRLAIETGYRHVDTGAYYKNEKGIGAAIRDSGIPRGELFVTSKVWTDHRGYEKTLESFEQSLDRLGLDYLDLFLIHWPAVPEKAEQWRELNYDTWRAIETLYKSGAVKMIGVSNFMPKHLKALMEDAEIDPMVDQIEFHAGFTQSECVSFCKEKRIRLEAWSSLGRGEALNHPTILALAEKYGITAAQLCLQWVRQCGLLPLVKSSSVERMKENLVAVKALEENDVSLINAIPHFGRLGYSPETVRF